MCVFRPDYPIQSKSVAAHTDGLVAAVASFVSPGNTVGGTGGMVPVPLGEKIAGGPLLATVLHHLPVDFLINQRISRWNLILIGNGLSLHQTSHQSQGDSKEYEELHDGISVEKLLWQIVVLLSLYSNPAARSIGPGIPIGEFLFHCLFSYAETHVSGVFNFFRSLTMGETLDWSTVLFTLPWAC